MNVAKLDAIRNTRPTNRDWLHNWIRRYTGITIARQAVCCGHQAPFDPMADQFLDRHNHRNTLVLGSRGSGKSFGAAINLHLDCRFNVGHKARILGGSKDQSRQIYEALSGHIQDGHGTLGGDGESIVSLLKESAEYRNGSEVAILAASATSVRGPHVPTLCLDEVDEIDPEIRQAAIGMKLGKQAKSQVISLAGVVRQTSTWHKPSGPMAKLIEQAKNPKEKNRAKLYTYCVFEVLERCPEWRSGKHLEKCPECPIFRWCHEDRFNDPSRPPKAKISDGHYPIDDLCDNVSLVSLRVFEADYLCKGPKADGIWFPQFDEAKHVSVDAEFNPSLPVHLAIDIGNRTGAVWFQVREVGDQHLVTVFADFYSDNAPTVEGVARAILAVGNERCLGRRDRVSHDPAGNSKTAIGPSVIQEYERVGWKGMRAWPRTTIVDSLALLESFVEDASGSPWLKIHPRCKHLIEAMQTYQRGGNAPQWSDLPKDPQHPAEDMIDALRGGLTDKFPNGRKPSHKGPTRSVAGLFT